MKSTYEMFLDASVRDPDANIASESLLVQAKLAEVNKASQRKAHELLPGAPSPFEMDAWRLSNPSATERDELDFVNQRQQQYLDSLSETQSFGSAAWDGSGKAVGTLGDMASGTGALAARGVGLGERIATGRFEEALGGAAEAAAGIGGIFGEIGQGVADLAGYSNEYRQARESASDGLADFFSGLDGAREAYRQGEATYGDKAALALDQDALAARKYREENWGSEFNKRVNQDRAAINEGYEKAIMDLLPENATSEQIAEAKRAITANTLENISGSQLIEEGLASAPYLLGAGVGAGIGSKTATKSLSKKLDEIRKDDTKTISERNTLIQDAKKKAAERGAFVGSTVAVGALEGSSNARDVVSEVYKASEGQLLETNDDYLKLRMSGVSDKEARERLAASMANTALAATGTVAAAFNVATGGVAEKALAGVNRTKGALANSGKIAGSAATEMIEEAGQSAAGQISTNTAIQQTQDKNKDLQEGTIGAAIEGGIIGAFSAGGMTTASTLLQRKLDQGKAPKPFDKELVEIAANSPEELKYFGSRDLYSLTAQWLKTPVQEGQEAVRETQRSNLQTAVLNQAGELIRDMGLESTQDEKIQLAAKTRLDQLLAVDVALAGGKAAPNMVKAVDSYLDTVEASTEDVTEDTARAINNLGVNKLTDDQLERVRKVFEKQGKVFASGNTSQTSSSSSPAPQPAPLLLNTHALITAEQDLRTALKAFEGGAKDVAAMVQEGGFNTKHQKAFKGLLEYQANISKAIDKGNRTAVEKEISDLSYWVSRQERKNIALAKAVAAIEALPEAARTQEALNQIAETATQEAGMQVKGSKEDSAFYIKANKIDAFVGMADNVQADTTKLGQYYTALVQRAEAGIVAEEQKVWKAPKHTPPATTTPVRPLNTAASKTYWEDPLTRPIREITWNSKGSKGEYFVQGMTAVQPNYLLGEALRDTPAYRVDLMDAKGEPHTLVVNQNGELLYKFRRGNAKAQKVNAGSVSDFADLVTAFAQRTGSPTQEASPKPTSSTQTVETKGSTSSTAETNPEVFKTPSETQTVETPAATQPAKSAAEQLQEALGKGVTSQSDRTKLFTLLKGLVAPTELAGKVFDLMVSNLPKGVVLRIFDPAKAERYPKEIQQGFQQGIGALAQETTAWFHKDALQASVLAEMVYHELDHLSRMQKLHDAYRANTPEYQELSRIWQEQAAKGNPFTDGGYAQTLWDHSFKGTQTVDAEGRVVPYFINEMITAARTNKEMRNYFAGQKYENASLLDKLKAALQNLLGLTPDEMNLYWAIEALSNDAQVSSVPEVFEVPQEGSTEVFETGEQEEVNALWEPETTEVNSYEDYTVWQAEAAPTTTTTAAPETSERPSHKFFGQGLPQEAFTVLDTFLERLNKAVGKAVQVTFKGEETQALKVVSLTPMKTAQGNTSSRMEVTLEDSKGRKTAYTVSKKGVLYAYNADSKDRASIGKINLPERVAEPHWFKQLGNITRKRLGQEVNRVKQLFVSNPDGAGMLARIPFAIHQLLQGKDFSHRMPGWNEVRDSVSFQQFLTMTDTVLPTLQEAISKSLHASLERDLRGNLKDVTTGRLNNIFVDMRTSNATKGEPLKVHADVVAGMLAGIFNFLADDFHNLSTDKVGLPEEQDPTRSSTMGSTRVDVVNKLGKHIFNTLGLRERTDADVGSKGNLSNELGAVAFATLEKLGFFQRIAQEITNEAGQKVTPIRVAAAGTVALQTSKYGSRYVQLFNPEHIAQQLNQDAGARAMYDLAQAIKAASTQDMDKLNGFFSRAIEEDYLLTEAPDVPSKLSFGEALESGNVPAAVQEVTETIAQVPHMLDLSFANSGLAEDTLLTLVQYASGYDDAVDSHTQQKAESVRSQNNQVDKTLKQLRRVFDHINSLRQTTPDAIGEFFYGYHYSVNMRQQQEGPMSRMNNLHARALLVPSNSVGKVKRIKLARGNKLSEKTIRALPQAEQDNFIAFISAIGLGFDAEMAKSGSVKTFIKAFNDLDLPTWVKRLQELKKNPAGAEALGKALHAEFGTSTAAITALMAWDQYLNTEVGEEFSSTIQDANDAKTSALGIALRQLDGETSDRELRLARVHMYLEKGWGEIGKRVNELSGWTGLDSYMTNANVFAARLEKFLPGVNHLYGSLVDSTGAATKKARNFFKNFTMIPVYSAKLGGQVNDQITKQLVPAIVDQLDSIYRMPQSTLEEIDAKGFALQDAMLNIFSSHNLFPRDWKAQRVTGSWETYKAFLDSGLRQLHHLSDLKIDFNPSTAEYEISYKTTSVTIPKEKPEDVAPWNVVYSKKSSFTKTVAFKDLVLPPSYVIQASAKLKEAYYLRDALGEKVYDEVTRQPIDEARENMRQLVGNALDVGDAYEKAMQAMGINYLTRVALAEEAALKAQWEEYAAPLGKSAISFNVYRERIGLAKTKQEEIRKAHQHLLPAIKTALHNDAADTNDNRMVLLSSTSVLSEDASPMTVDIPSWKWDDGEDVSGFKVNQYHTVSTARATGSAALSTHGVDAATQYGTIREVPEAQRALNTHDSFTEVFTDKAAVSQGQNKVFHELNNKYSYVEEAIKRGDEIAKEHATWFQGLTETEQAAYKAKSEEIITQSSEGYPLTPEQIGEIQERMLSPAAELKFHLPGLQANRQAIATGLKSINHYEGTPYVPKDSQGDSSAEDIMQFAPAVNMPAALTSSEQIFDALVPEVLTAQEATNIAALRDTLHTLNQMGQDTLRVTATMNAGAAALEITPENMFRRGTTTTVGTPEHYVSELVRAYAGYWIDNSPASRNELKHIWTQLRAVAKADTTLWNQNKALFEKIFDPVLVEGRAAYLQDFAGALYTNPVVKQLAEQSLSAAQPSWFSGATVAEKLANFLSRMVSLFTDRYMHNPAPQLDKRARALLSHIMKIDAEARGMAFGKNKNALEQLGSKFHLDEFTVDKLFDTFAINMAKLGQVGNVVNGVVVAPYYMLKPAKWDSMPLLKLIREFGRDANNWLYERKNVLADLLADLMVSFSQETGTNTQLVDAIHNTKTHVDGISDKIRKGVAEALMRTFDPERPVSNEEATALTYVLAKARLYSLMDLGSNYSTMFEMVRSGKARKAEITRIEAELSRLTQGDNFYKVQSQNLAFLMVDGAGAGLELPRYNARSISRGRNWGAVNPQIEKLVDHLTTLHALEKLPAKTMKLTWEVMQHELARTNEEGQPLQENGVSTALHYFASLWDDAKAKNFKGAEDLMFAGHIGDHYEQSISMKTADTPNDAALLAMGYEMQGKVPSDKVLKNGDTYLYTHPYANTETFISGALVRSTNQSRGTDIDPVHLSPAKVAAKHAMDNQAYASGKLKIVRQGSSAQPKYSPEGQITGFRFIMSEEHKDKLLGRETHFAKVAGLMSAAVETKARIPDVNKTTLEALESIFNNATPSMQAKHFVFISPKSGDSALRKLWNELPEATRADAIRMFGHRGIPVRRVDLEKVQGTRDIQFVKPFLKSPEDRKAMEKMLVNSLSFLLGEKASWRVAQAQNIVEGLGKFTKDAILIRSGVVTAFNTLSNFLLNGVHGVGPVNQAKWGAEAMTEARKIQKGRLRIIELDVLLQNPKVPQATRTKWLQEKARIVEDSQNTLVAKMIEMGQLQNIEDLFARDIEKDGRFEKILGTPIVDEFYHKWVPEGSKRDAAISNATIEPGSWLHNQLQFAAQMSDFTAKYAYAKHQILTKGMEPEEAIREARRLFIDYALPEGQLMNALNKIGVAYFLKYVLRVQKTILLTAGKHPMRTLLMMFLTDMAGVESSIMDSFMDNPLNRLNDPISAALGALDAPLTARLL